ncbi:MAG: HEAT repeat domain-containing protein [Candidatus Odinarchaeota archaeon]
MKTTAKEFSCYYCSEGKITTGRSGSSCSNDSCLVNLIDLSFSCPFCRTGTVLPAKEQVFCSNDRCTIRDHVELLDGILQEHDGDRFSTFDGFLKELPVESSELLSSMREEYTRLLELYLLWGRGPGYDTDVSGEVVSRDFHNILYFHEHFSGRSTSHTFYSCIPGLWYVSPIGERDAVDIIETCALDLVDSQDPLAIVPLLVALNSGKSPRKDIYIFALGKLGDERVIPLLEQIALENVEFSERDAAVDAIGGIGTVSAIDSLVRLLELDDSRRGNENFICNASLYLNDLGRLRSTLRQYIVTVVADALVTRKESLATKKRFLERCLEILHDGLVENSNDGEDIEYARQAISRIKPLLLSVILGGDNSSKKLAKGLLALLDE